MKARLILTLTLVLGLVSAASAAWAAQPNHLFAPAATADGHGRALAALTESHVARGRLVTADPAAAELSQLSLNLFSDLTINARRTSLTRTASGRRLWRGVDPEDKLSSVILVLGQEGITGNISRGAKMYQIRPLGGGLHAVTQVDQSAFPDEGQIFTPLVGTDPNSLGDDPAAPQPVGDDPPQAYGDDDGSTIDILVAYTTRCATSSSDILAEIDLMIAETNQAFANSNITPRVRLVGTIEVAYSESGSLSTDLSRVQNTSDGFMDEVHAKRDEVAADVVTLIVNSGDNCGMGYHMSVVTPTFAPYAFTTVKRSCATGYYSFGHELGHVLGANHDCYVSSWSLSPYTYIHGYVNVPRRWRTIMAYNNACTAQGASCTRIIYFSNPEIVYGGEPMGDLNSCGADVHQTINNTALVVANWRDAPDDTEPPPPPEPDNGMPIGFITPLIVDSTVIAVQAGDPDPAPVANPAITMLLVLN